MSEHTPPKPPASGAVRIRTQPADAGAPAPTVRLNKRMADLGLCSRREADDWIARGWVRVNGAPAVMGQPVAVNARIEVAREAEQQQRGQLKDHVSIKQRPAIVNEKSRIGDWEGDTVIGKAIRARWSRWSSAIHATPWPNRWTPSTATA